MDSAYLATKSFFYSRISNILRCPRIIFPLLDVFFAMAGIAMVEAMLSPHLKNNGASDIDIGFVFLSVTVSCLFGFIVFGQVNKFLVYRRNNFKVVKFFFISPTIDL